MLIHITFFVLAFMALGSGVLVVTQRNPVHSALWLIVTLFSVGGIFLMLHAEFLFAVQIILYVGGVVVLILFVVMLVSVDMARRQQRYGRHGWLALLTVLLLGGELAYGLYGRGRGMLLAPVTFNARGMGNTQAVATGLYQSYMLPVEIASLLLLVAMIGAVIMAKRKFD
jgi:NADH-quinone oxidoreductase subunit J